MNEINSFTFYKNYYELLDNLPKEDKYIMLEAIVDYVFKDNSVTDLINRSYVVKEIVDYNTKVISYV